MIVVASFRLYLSPFKEELFFFLKNFIDKKSYFKAIRNSQKIIKLHIRMEFQLVF